VGADVGMGVGVRAHVCDMMIVIVYYVRAHVYILCPCACV